MILVLILLIVVACVIFNAVTYVVGALIGVGILIAAALVRRHRRKKAQEVQSNDLS